MRADSHEFLLGGECTRMKTTPLAQALDALQFACAAAAVQAQFMLGAPATAYQGAHQQLEILDVVRATTVNACVSSIV